MFTPAHRTRVLLFLWRRTYSSSPGNKAQAFQNLLDLWPPDTCNRKMTFQGEFAKRIQKVMSNPSSQANQALLDQSEFDSLSRILSNYHRDRYKMPTGLGQAALNSNAPRIAATGADLLECRRILSNQDEYLRRRVPMRERLWTVLKQLFWSDSVKLNKSV
ncbi:unnamed protein product [Echinostoma caproni]|uniref:Ubiquinol-cytochrome-c reductase complex assembly factor 2 n=1 Tax=Echinostoma caproni TaxID=27848 RepID=A0A183AYK3_9TREM|nr:unnamed protein product [Echinostoma caproni]